MVSTDQISARLLALLRKVGTTATLQKKTDTLVSTEETTQSITTHTVTLALLNYALKFIDGTLIQQGDRKAIIAKSGLSVEPMIGDALVFQSVTYAILDVRHIFLRDTAVAYVCQLRR